MQHRGRVGGLAGVVLAHVALALTALALIALALIALALIALALIALAVIALAVPAIADPGPQLPLPIPQPAREYAPLDRPGPALRVADDDLADALDCTASVDGAGRPPVLLIPGTTLTAEENFSWNYERAFAADDRPYCTVTLPNHAMSDTQFQISRLWSSHTLRTQKSPGAH